MKIFTAAIVILALIPSAAVGRDVERGVILSNTVQYGLAFPSEGFTAYNLQKEKIGKLGKDNDDTLDFYFIDDSSVKTGFVPKYRRIEYELYALNYNILHDDGFVEIEQHTTGIFRPNQYDKLSVLVKLEEIEKLGFKTVPWMQVLVKNVGYLGYYAGGQGLRLRTESSTDSDIILLAYGGLFAISLTGETDGNWARVTVTKYKKSEPCSLAEDDIEYTKEGWMKVLDDEGNPNLVWSVSC